MSATRDKTQKIAFVYSNLYQIYKKGVEAAHNAPEVGPAVSAEPLGLRPGLRTERPESRILKSENVHAQASVRTAAAPAPKVSEYQPMEILRRPTPAVIRNHEPAVTRAVPNAALAGLKDNLQTLNDLHSRLKFMLQELEDLVKKD